MLKKYARIAIVAFNNMLKMAIVDFINKKIKKDLILKLNNYKYNLVENFFRRIINLPLISFEYCYDEAVSLGYNCEPIFRIQDAYLYSKEVKNCIFSWTYINNREKFLEILADLDKLNNVEFEIGKYGMLEDKYSKIAFHQRDFGALTNEKGEINQEVFDKCVEELKSRIAHLVQNTKDLFNSEEKTLFVMKAPKTELEKDREFIENVYKILEEKYISGKFKLLVVVPRNQYSKNDLLYLREIENSKLKISDIQRYADEGNNWYDGDRVGWLLSILKELNKFSFNLDELHKIIEPTPKNLKSFKSKFVYKLLQLIRIFTSRNSFPNSVFDLIESRKEDFVYFVFAVLRNSKIKDLKIFKYNIAKKIIDFLIKLHFININPKYDRMVSLGYNCEPSSRMADVYTVLYPQIMKNFLFSWTYINNREKFLEILTDLDKLNNTKFKVGIYDMLQDEYSEIAFHKRNFGSLRNEKGEINQEVFDKCVEELKSRIAHLVEKTKSLFNSEEKTLFVMKAPKTELEKDREFIENVYKILEEKYVSGKFKLLVVVPRNEYSKNDILYLRTVENSRLKIADIKRYSDEVKNDYDGDRIGWFIKLLKEYIT